MKNMLLLIFSALMIATTSNAENIVTLKSKVTAATVFLNRASVSRSATVSLTAGQYELELPLLTADLVEESVRVSGRGSAGLKILDVKVTTEHTAEIQEEITRRIQAQMDSLQREVNKISNRIKVFENQKQFVESIQAESIKNINQSLTITRPTIQNWQDILKFIDGNLGAIYENIRLNEEQRRTLLLKKEALNNNLSRKNSDQDKIIKKIIVSTQVEKQGTFELQFSYFVYGASWSPMYDMRVRPDEEQMELTYQGLVRQNTGENWENISLTLSTARPMDLLVFPALSPWFLTMPAPEREYKLKRGKAESVVEVMDADGVELQAGINEMALQNMATFSIAEVRENITSAVYDLPLKVNIPSDNFPHNVAIGIEEMPVNFKYLTIPKRIEKTFLQGEIVNKTQYTLLDGPANIFINNEFINKTQINTIVPTDTFELALGIDDAIKVERHLAKKFVEKQGLLGGKKLVTLEYEIVLKNNRKTARNVKVIDQLPISQNEELKVSLLEPEPNQVKIDQQNQVIWDVRLMPGETKRIPFKFQIEFPKNAVVQGLD